MRYMPLWRKYCENNPHVKCLANIFAKFPPAKITTFTVSDPEVIHVALFSILMHTLSSVSPLESPYKGGLYICCMCMVLRHSNSHQFPAQVLVEFWVWHICLSGVLELPTCFRWDSCLETLGVFSNGWYRLQPWSSLLSCSHVLGHYLEQSDESLERYYSRKALVYCGESLDNMHCPCCQ